MAEQDTAPQGDDKKFADFLGDIFEGGKKDLSATLAFFVDKLRDQRGQAQKLSQAIQQAEQQLAQLKSQAIRLEGQYAEGVSAVRHFWEKEGAPAPEGKPA